MNNYPITKMWMVLKLDLDASNQKLSSNNKLLLNNPKFDQQIFHHESKNKITFFLVNLNE